MERLLDFDHGNEASYCCRVTTLAPWLGLVYSIKTHWQEQCKIVGIALKHMWQLRSNSLKTAMSYHSVACLQQTTSLIQCTHY